MAIYFNMELKYINTKRLRNKLETKRISELENVTNDVSKFSLDEKKYFFGEIEKKSEKENFGEYFSENFKRDAYFRSEDKVDLSIYDYYYEINSEEYSRGKKLSDLTSHYFLDSNLEFDWKFKNDEVERLVKKINNLIDDRDILGNFVLGVILFSNRNFITSAYHFLKARAMMEHWSGSQVLKSTIDKILFSLSSFTKTEIFLKIGMSSVLDNIRPLKVFINRCINFDPNTRHSSTFYNVQEHIVASSILDVISLDGSNYNSFVINNISSWYFNDLKSHMNLNDKERDLTVYIAHGTDNSDKIDIDLSSGTKTVDVSEFVELLNSNIGNEKTLKSCIIFLACNGEKLRKNLNYEYIIYSNDLISEKSSLAFYSSFLSLLVFQTDYELSFKISKLFTSIFSPEAEKFLMYKKSSDEIIDI